MSYTFGFIGAGNMGGALAKAACNWRADEVLLTDHNLELAVGLAEQLDCDVAMDNSAVAREARFILLGVKPQYMADVLAEIAPVLQARQDRFVVVSMAAGLSLNRLVDMLGFRVPLIRIMPNTSVAVGQGMVLYAACPGVEIAEVEEFCEKMSAAGRFDPLPEGLIDAGGSVSGCGPAFVYQFIEALADGGVACGLPRQKAQEYAAQTLLGAAQMLLESGEHPGKLKDDVCSPGGSTIVGVHALKQGGFDAAVMNAVLAAYQKNKELGNR